MDSKHDTTLDLTPRERVQNTECSNRLTLLSLETTCCSRHNNKSMNVQYNCSVLLQSINHFLLAVIISLKVLCHFSMGRHDANSTHKERRFKDQGSKGKVASQNGPHGWGLTRFLKHEANRSQYYYSPLDRTLVHPKVTLSRMSKVPIRPSDVLTVRSNVRCSYHYTTAFPKSPMKYNVIHLSQEVSTIFNLH